MQKKYDIQYLEHLQCLQGVIRKRKSTHQQPKRRAPQYYQARMELDLLIYYLLHIQKFDTVMSVTKNCTPIRIQVIFDSLTRYKYF